MTVIKEGSKVEVRYIGTLDTGEEFDNTMQTDPVSFTVGKGEIIPGFEVGILGLKKDEEKEIHVSAEEGYGTYQQELIMEIPKAEFPDHIELKSGLELEVPVEDENEPPIPIKVLDVKEDQVVVDANHPLAGQTLIFKVKIVSVN